MPSKNISLNDKVSNPKKPRSAKIVFNLKDVNKDPQFIRNINPEVLRIQAFDKFYSLDMVYNAQLIIQCNNNFVNGWK